MAIEIYSTNELLGVVETMFPPTSYWLELCFNMEQNFDTETIMFDQVRGARRMAPFVLPTLQGRVLKHAGYTTKSFKPAYIKPKDVVNPGKLLQRLAGEKLMGSMTPQQREDAIVASYLKEQYDMIYRRWEWMAFNAVAYSAVTVAGDDYPAVVVQFGRQGNQTITLSGAALWSATSTADPLKNIEDWATLVFQRSGQAITRLTFGLAAWQAFIKLPGVKDQLDTNYRGNEGASFTRGPGKGEAFAYKGRLDNGTELWVYNDLYEDASGNLQPIMNTNTVIGTSPGIQGVRCFGAIMDKRAGYQPLSIFPKMWEEEDPSVLYMMTQSAPLMIPTNPDASFIATVL